MCSAQLAIGMDRDDVDFDLRDIDEEILDLLEKDRQTRQNLARILDVTGEYVYQRIDLLIKIGVVEKIHDGFYQLTDDDLGDHANDVESVTETDSGEFFEEVELPTALADEIARYQKQLERSNTGNVDARARAAEAVGRMLVAEGGVSRSDAQERLLPELGIDDVNKDTWWQRAGKDRFAKVDEIQWSQSEQKYVLTD